MTKLEQAARQRWPECIFCEGTEMITLTSEQAQQIEEALEDIVRVFKFETGTPVEALATIRAARAQEQAKQEQAKQEPVGEVVLERMGAGDAQIVRFQMYGKIPPVGTKLYAAPVSIAKQSETDSSSSLMRTAVRTKDLTDDEIMKINVDTAGIVPTCNRQFHFARAVIAADREKNK